MSLEDSFLVKSLTVVHKARRASNALGRPMSDPARNPAIEVFKGLSFSLRFAEKLCVNPKVPPMAAEICVNSGSMLNRDRTYP